jgi:hypothetical protein
MTIGLSSTRSKCRRRRRRDRSALVVSTGSLRSPHRNVRRGQTAGCRERGAIVFGLLFTMKIPTIACGPQSRSELLPLHMMTPRRRETFPPVTLGHIRGHGCRNLLVYCTSGWCNHSMVMNADGLPDEMPVRSLCQRMVCTACGLIGADVRPDWSPHTNRRPS